jgi:hypothetical protein
LTLAEGINVRNITTTSSHFNTSVPVEIWDFFDLITFRCPELLSAHDEEFLRKHSYAFKSESSRFPMRGFAGRRYHIVAPEQQALRRLVQLDVHLTCTEVARNWIMPEQQAAAMHAHFDKHFVQLWHGNRQLKWQGSSYSGQRKPQGYHHFAWYSDRPCKRTGEECFHLEGRYQGSVRLRRIGISRTQDLLNFNFQNYWSQQWKKYLRLWGIDFERLGRLHSNLRCHSKRKLARIRRTGRFVYNEDYEVGCRLYRYYGQHQDSHSTQQFIDQFGRGPYVIPITTLPDIPHTVKKSSGQVSCSIKSRVFDDVCEVYT